MGTGEGNKKIRPPLGLAPQVVVANIFKPPQLALAHVAAGRG